MGGYSAAAVAVAAVALAAVMAVVGAASEGDTLAGLAGGAAGIDAAPGTYSIHARAFSRHTVAVICFLGRWSERGGSIGVRSISSRTDGLMGPPVPVAVALHFIPQLASVGD
jgi:hypothetical protein